MRFIIAGLALIGFMFVLMVGGCSLLVGGAATVAGAAAQRAAARAEEEGDTAPTSYASDRYRYSGERTINDQVRAAAERDRSASSRARYNYNSSYQPTGGVGQPMMNPNPDD